MAKNLVIVESPTKAKTLKKYLGAAYTVTASRGHVRDLPPSGMGVDTEADFAPEFVVPTSSAKTVSALQSAVKRSGTVYLATDLDREGEAIAWHVAEAVGMDPKTALRVTFDEITELAVRQAFERPRRINFKLVDAYKARRILDRLVGYELSPVLWRKVKSGLSAGRVQSVALRLIVDREREIQAFEPVEYWSLDADLSTEKEEGEVFSAALQRCDGEKLEIRDQDQAEGLVRNLETARYGVGEVRTREVKRNPSPPFTTSTLQQEAARKLSFSSKKTMAIAQQLYEGIDLGADEGQAGLITYMRTDSVHLADQALAEITAMVQTRFGSEYALGKPRRFKTRSKGAQEAHEAIRPTSASRHPDDVQSALSSDQLRLYRLIWQRAVASQMAQARFRQVSADVDGVAVGGSPVYGFRATGQTLLFDGFMAVYTEGRDDDGDDDRDRYLPELTRGQLLFLRGLRPEQHFTQPPPRYSEASLVKALEENGIGRPSTYAPTISTLLERGYVLLQDRRFYPEEVGIVVTDLLTEHVPDIVDIGFTARMEDQLDDVAGGNRAWVEVLRSFYDDFERYVDKFKSAERPQEDIGEPCPECGKALVSKFGRYGRFIACTGYPECRYRRPLREASEPEVTDQVCEKCGRPMLKKTSRYGPFLGCSGYPECKNTKSMEEGTGVTCPQCREGELVPRRSRRGKLFYSCNRYPECELAVWQRPVPVPCPECSGLVTVSATTARCEHCKAKLNRDEVLSSVGT
jgi:DNA topoisomerase I